ncbi:hypothetical protein [Ottowia sp.]|uniref:hypothetical protein n=1 Tax=Ottowia sp. TaxID=1898956 RepID=UPI003A8AED25
MITILLGLACVVVAVLWAWLVMRLRRRFSASYGGQTLSGLWMVVAVVPLAALAFVIVRMEDQVAAYGYRFEHVRPMQTQCRQQRDGQACHDLAQLYHQGKTVAYDSTSRWRGGTSNRRVQVIRPDPDQAVQFAQWACEAGHDEGCLDAAVWGRTPAEELATLAQGYCQKQVLLGCDVYLSKHPQALLSDMLTEAQIQALCATRNVSACIYQSRDAMAALLRAPERPSVSQIMQMVNGFTLGALAHRPETAAQQAAQVQLQQVVQVQTLGSTLMQPDPQARQALLERMMAVPMPALAPLDAP